MGRFIQTEREGHVLLITLDRPEVLNALHAPACHELSAVFDEFAEDEDLWIAIITGAGKAFCAGHDLVDGFFEPMPETGWAGLSRRHDLFKPMICAVNGLAMGGGWEIAMACDVVVADEHATFALPEPRVGFAALGGGAAGLVRRMSWHAAMGLLLTGDRIDAATAHRHGMVTEVAPPGKVLDVARHYAGSMLRCSPLALRATKRVALAALEPPATRTVIEALSLELAAELSALEDTGEGIEAFKEKRAPIWAGR